MSNFEIISFGSAEQLAIDVAGRWLQQLQAVPAGTRYSVALSGGRITKNFFAEIVLRVKKEPEVFKGIFQNVHFFWADDRCVPVTDPENNYAIARELFFEPLGIVLGQIHRLRGEGPEPEALSEAIREISQIAPGPGGVPVLDLIFLGMGEDGHIASLFPGEPREVMEQPAIYRAVTAVKPPPRRITLGYGVIAAAREVWVLASGKGKEAAFKESLSPAGQTPLARVLQSRKKTRILTDITLT